MTDRRSSAIVTAVIGGARPDALNSARPSSSESPTVGHTARRPVGGREDAQQRSGTRPEQAQRPVEDGKTRHDRRPTAGQMLAGIPAALAPEPERPACCAADRAPGSFT
jgi:hypothetical protein